MTCNNEPVESLTTWGLSACLMYCRKYLWCGVVIWNTTLSTSHDLANCHIHKHCKAGGEDRDEIDLYFKGEHLMILQQNFPTLV